jgi:hypothetical protein
VVLCGGYGKHLDALEIFMYYRNSPTLTKELEFSHSWRRIVAITWLHGSMMVV